MRVHYILSGDGAMGVPDCIVWDAAMGEWYEHQGWSCIMIAVDTAVELIKLHCVRKVVLK